MTISVKRPTLRSTPESSVLIPSKPLAGPPSPQARSWPVPSFSEASSSRAWRGQGERVDAPLCDMLGSELSETSHRVRVCRPAMQQRGNRGARSSSKSTRRNRARAARSGAFFRAGGQSGRECPASPAIAFLLRTRGSSRTMERERDVRDARETRSGSGGVPAEIRLQSALLDVFLPAMKRRREERGRRARSSQHFHPDERARSAGAALPHSHSHSHTFRHAGMLTQTTTLTD